MTRRKAEIASRLPIRRGLEEAEAAIYVGIGTTLFQKLVEGGQMPRPRLLGKRKIWDVDDLDAAFRSLPREGEHPKIRGPNPWHE